MFAGMGEPPAELLPLADEVAGKLKAVMGRI
jgi:hypothetical protein